MIEWKNLWVLFYRRWRKSYTILCQRLAGSASYTSTQGVWMLWGFWLKNHPAWTVHWNEMIYESENLVRDYFISCLWKKKKKKNKDTLLLNIMHQAEATVCWLGSSSRRRAAAVSPHGTCVLSFFPFAAEGRGAAVRGSKTEAGPEAVEAGPARSCCAFLSPGPQMVPVFSAAVCAHLPSFLNEAIPSQKQRC